MKIYHQNLRPLSHPEIEDEKNEDDGDMSMTAYYIYFMKSLKYAALILWLPKLKFMMLI